MKTDIIRKIEESKSQYYRLILIVGPANSGKTTLLQDIGREIGSEILNVNLELSKSLLELSHKQRMRKVAQCLSDIINNHYQSGDTVLLDNTEILFDVELKQDPLKLLQQLSRDRCVITSWNGKIENDSLVYADSDHREYRTYHTKDLTVFYPDGSALE